jgi:hypothetical protein
MVELLNVFLTLKSTNTTTRAEYYPAETPSDIARKTTPLNLSEGGKPFSGKIVLKRQI